MIRVAVVGGGASGLMAAWKLASAKVAVTLFERGSQLGGRARSEVLNGCIVDTGAQLFGSAFSTLRRTARAVGADPLLVHSPGRDALYRNHRLHPITYGSVSSMVRSSALPAGLKLKLGARYVPFLLRHARQLDVSDPLAAGGDALDTTSVADWGGRELGRDFLELLAYPQLGAYYGAPPERISVALYHSLAKAGLDVTVYAVRGGTGALMDRIAEAARQHGAQFRTGTAVSQVQPAGDVVRILHGDDTDEFDAAIMALPAPEIAERIALPAAVQAWLDAVEFTPAVVLALVLDRPVHVDVFGVSLVRNERMPSDVVAICVQANKAPGLVPPDRGLLICLSAPHASPALIADEDAAVERMIAAVEAVFPGTRAHIEHARLYRHEAGYPVFYPGYLKHLRHFPASQLPHGIQLAGDYLVAPTVEGAMRSGERAAEAVLRYARRST